MSYQFNFSLVSNLNVETTPLSIYLVNKKDTICDICINDSINYINVSSIQTLCQELTCSKVNPNESSHFNLTDKSSMISIVLPVIITEGFIPQLHSVYADYNADYAINVTSFAELKIINSTSVQINIDLVTVKKVLGDALFDIRVILEFVVKSQSLLRFRRALQNEGEKMKPTRISSVIIQGISANNYEGNSPSNYQEDRG